MRKIALTAAVVLAALPGAALAAKPVHPTHPTHPVTPVGKGQGAKVTFVLRGTLGAYTAANGATNGSIAITVKRSNHESSLLKNTTLALPVSSSTKVVGTITSGHNGIVKVRAAKNAPAATLQTLAATQAIDQGAAS
jgi:hypothetical protein